MTEPHDLNTPMSASDVFHFSDQQANFDALAVLHGESATWLASDLMASLGYQSMGSFQKVINKAIGTCTTLGISVLDNFTQEAGGGYRLSRFACYLIAMQGDSSKPEVARAQAYFAALAEAFRRYVQEAQD